MPKISPSAGWLDDLCPVGTNVCHSLSHETSVCRVHVVVESTIGCTLLDTSQTTLPVPCYVRYTSSCICCRLHVIRVTMHYRLRAVCSPHGLTNTCARQASGSVSRCHSERPVMNAHSTAHTHRRSSRPCLRTCPSFPVGGMPRCVRCADVQPCDGTCDTQ